MEQIVTRVTCETDEITGVIMPGIYENWKACGGKTDWRSYKTYR